MENNRKYHIDGQDISSHLALSCKALEALQLQIWFSLMTLCCEEIMNSFPQMFSKEPAAQLRLYCKT